jgi:6-phosphogluconolactonase
MTRPAHGILHIYDDVPSLALGAAEFITGRARLAPDRFVLALAGGSTPKPVYQAMAQLPFAAAFPWGKTVFTIGDERFVPLTDPASNWAMIQAAMLAHVPATGTLPLPVEGVSIAEAAARFEAGLQELYGGTSLQPGKPLFDVTLLGLGDDGHTASLLPGQPVLEVRDRWVAEVDHGRAEARVTLTYPALNASRTVVFLVAGAGKHEMLHHVLSGATDVPAAGLDVDGDIHWFVDRAAYFGP